MDNHPRQYSIRSRTGLYLVLICHIFSDWSGTEIITSRLMHKHTHTYKTQSCNHRIAERCWTLMPVMQCTTNMDSPKEMLDQKQNWLVSGAYLSHIFRLERHRNHHVETHAQTHSHVNTKIHSHTNTKTYITEGQPSMIVYERLNGF